MRRITWFVGLLVGILLIAAAPVVRWAVAPAVTHLPGNTDTLRVYTGTAATVINPSVLHGTLFGPALLHNQPVTVQHRVTVVATKGADALVSERKTVSLPGTTIANVVHRYAVDRKSMGRGNGFSDVTGQTGVTFNWPIHTQKKDYTGWVGDTQSTTTLRYAGTATRGGVKTYVFTSTVPSGRITDPAMLANLPAAMPKSLLNSLVPSLGLSLDQLKALGELLPKLPDPVPFAYLYNSTSTFWVAPDSGVVVDVASHEVRTSAVILAGRVIPVGSMLDFSYTAPTLTVQAAANDAKDKASQMQLISTTIPVIALTTGAVLLLVVIGLAIVSRRRRATAVPSVPAPRRELTPVG